MKVAWNKGLTIEDSRIAKGIKKMVKTRMERNNYKQKPETIDKIRKTLQNIPKTKEWNEKNRQSNIITKRKFWNSKESDKTRELIRQARLKQKINRISKAEIRVKEYLESKNIKFIMQYVYPLGIADFYLSDYKIIIQCYGSYWHSLPSYIERDKKQNQWFKDNGYKIIILNSERVLEDIKEVEKICQNI
jgi:very-short-patch-repair endonuclease